MVHDHSIISLHMIHNLKTMHTQSKLTMVDYIIGCDCVYDLTSVSLTDSVLIARAVTEGLPVDLLHACEIHCS